MKPSDPPSVPAVPAPSSPAVPCPGCERSLRLPPQVDQPTGLCPHCGCEMDLSRWQSGEVARLAEPVAASLVGRGLGGYQLQRIVGRGGTGYVYLGEDVTTREEVAVKVLRDDLKNNARVVERFERESEALARLNHPNIVSLLDRGQEEGLYFLVMERVGTGSGPPTSLKSLIRRRALTIPQSIRIVQKILSALEAAHRQDIIHRDVKPTNILIDDDGEVKVTDFGIARFLRSPRPAGGPSGEGTDPQIILGSLAYMAPEQKRNSHAVDRRADIYSVGVLFYEMIVGRRPGLKWAPPSEILAGLGSFLDPILARALESSPALRYQSAADMLADLERALDSPGGDTVTSTRVAIAELEWEEGQEEDAKGEYRCPLCEKVGPSEQDRCFYCGLSKRRRCPRCQVRHDLAVDSCTACGAKLPDLRDLVTLVREAETAFEAFRRDRRRTARRVEIAQLLLERYERARDLGADERDVRARVSEVRRELVRMLFKSAQALAARGDTEAARLELGQVLQFGEFPEARRLLEDLESPAAPADPSPASTETAAAVAEAPAPAEFSADVAPREIAFPAAVSEEPIEFEAAGPIPAPLPPPVRVRTSRLAVLGLLAVGAAAVLAAGSAQGWLPDFRYGRSAGRTDADRLKSWAEADAMSRRLADRGRLFEAASTLYEARNLPDGRGGSSEADRIAAWIERSVRRELEGGDVEEACRQLAWWTARFPGATARSAEALEREILVARIDADVRESDFASAAESMRFLASLAPDGYVEQRKAWTKLLADEVLEAVSAGEYQAASDALRVLAVWGDKDEQLLGRRCGEVVDPFVSDPRLAEIYRPYFSPDLGFGMPIPKSLGVRIVEGGRLQQFVLTYPAAEGKPVEIGPVLQIVVLPAYGTLAAPSVADEALRYRNTILAGQKTVETGHVRFELDGRPAESYTFRRPAEGGGTATFVEFYLVEADGLYYIITLIIPEPMVREIRSLLLVSLTRLRIF